MLFFSSSLAFSIFSLLVCQIFGRALDDPEENYLDHTFKPDFSTTNNEQNCNCVPKHMCRSYKNSVNNTDGRKGVILVKSIESDCTYSQYVCCQPSAIITSLSSDSGRIHHPRPNTPRDCKCAPIEKCQLYDGTIINNTNGEGLINPRSIECPDPQHICCDKLRESEAAKYVRKQATCGVRHESGIGFKISGNTEAQFGEFPSIVLLFKKKFRNEKELLQFNCGGTLIHLKVVLTAAHCVRSHVDKPELMVVRAGEWDTESTSETVSHQERVAEKIITHPSFNSGNKAYDVALIVLKEQFEFAENVDVICLPTADTDVNKANCTAIGWGKSSLHADSYSNIPKKVDLPLVPKADCQITVSASKPSFQLHESLICAGGKKGVDVCQGDGGGPLLCPVPGRDEIFQQVGIVSWGFGCGEEIPSFYTNVPMVRDWIDNEVENLGLEKSGFYELADSYRL